MVVDLVDLVVYLDVPSIDSTMLVDGTRRWYHGGTSSSGSILIVSSVTIVDHYGTQIVEDGGR